MKIALRFQSAYIIRPYSSQENVKKGREKKNNILNSDFQGIKHTNHPEMFVPVFQCPQKLVRTFNSIYRKHIVYTLRWKLVPTAIAICPWKPLLRIRIRRIGMLLGLPDPDPLV